jgi:hypothetical protein
MGVWKMEENWSGMTKKMKGMMQQRRRKRAWAVRLRQMKKEKTPRRLELQ